jgi:hypothetical protein
MKLKRFLTEKDDYKTQMEYQEGIEWLDDIAEWIEEGLGDTEDAVNKMLKELVSLQKNEVAKNTPEFMKLAKEFPQASKEWNRGKMKLVGMLKIIVKLNK